MPKTEKLKHIAAVVAASGWSGLLRAAQRALERRSERAKYAAWLRKFGTLDDARRAAIRHEIEKLGSRPLISVLMPVYNVEEKWLRRAIGSVRRQLYPNWELCIADDYSPSPHVRRVLNEYAENDGRIKVVFRTENGHISAASNSALELARGEFTVLLDHDDELSEDALFWVAKELNEFPETEMIYSDEDTIDERGRRFYPRFKPDFARDLFYSINLVTHLSAYRTSLLRRIGGFRVGFEGSQDYDLALRVIESIPESHIRHIPRILYHWRAIRSSAAFSSDAKPYAYEKARNALRLHFERTGVKARVEPTVLDLNRVRYELPNPQPLVSLIVHEYPDKEAPLRSATVYPAFEMISADELSASCLNSAAAAASGEILCFLDGHFHPLSPDWLNELVSFAAQKEIGAVGPKLINADGTIISAGAIIGQNGTVGAAHQGLLRREHGNFVRAQLIGNYSAVSIIGMTTRREVFEAAGGFDAANLEHRFFAADFCLRLRRMGYRIVYTPYAELARSNRINDAAIGGKESAEEYEYFSDKWRAKIARDPFYNPNLSKQGRTFSIGI